MGAPLGHVENRAALQLHADGAGAVYVTGGAVPSRTAPLSRVQPLDGT